MFQILQDAENSDTNFNFKSKSVNMFKIINSLLMCEFYIRLVLNK